MRVHSAPTTPAPPSPGQMPLGEEVGAHAGLASPPPLAPPCGPTGRSSWAGEGERPAVSVEGEREDDQQGEQKCVCVHVSSHIQEQLVVTVLVVL